MQYGDDFVFEAKPIIRLMPSISSVFPTSLKATLHLTPQLGDARWIFQNSENCSCAGDGFLLTPAQARRFGGFAPICPYSHATRGNVNVELEASGA